MSDSSVKPISPREAASCIYLQLPDELTRMVNDTLLENLNKETDDQNRQILVSEIDFTLVRQGYNSYGHLSGRPPLSESRAISLVESHFSEIGWVVTHRTVEKERNTYATIMRFTSVD